MTPRVSVIVPTHNRLAQLQRALAGVERQSFRDYEVVVVDDGSADSTHEWLSRQEAHVRLVRSAVAAGAGAARNRGVHASTGDLIAFLDDDDVWKPSYLERQVRHLDANPAASLSWADHVEVDARGHATLPDTKALLPYRSPLVRMLAECFIHTMSVVVCRRGLFQELGDFDERLRVVQDFEWYARALSSRHAFIHLAETLVARAVPGGLVTRHREWAREEEDVVSAALDAAGARPRDRRLVRAYRALYFAQLGLARKDIAFGLTRLAAAFGASPVWTLRVAGKRLTRRLARRLERRPLDLLDTSSVAS